MPTTLDVDPVGPVLGRSAVPLTGRVADQHDQPMDTIIAWSSTDPSVAVEAATVRCLERGDAAITATVGSLTATVAVSCHPDAVLSAPASARLLVGQAVPTITVRDGEAPLDFPVALTTTDLLIVAIAAERATGVAPGTATLRVTAGALTAEVPVEVVAPWARDQIYVTIDHEGARELVAISAAGEVHELVSLPGYEHGRGLFVDLNGARAAWTVRAPDGT